MVSKQPLSAMLAQVASIALIKTTSLGLSRIDKDGSRQADETHGAKAGTTRLNVSRLTPTGVERVKDIDRIAKEVRAELGGMTTAWNDMRLLPNTQLQKWLGIWGEAKKEYDAAVEKFVADAPTLIADAADNLKGFAKVSPPSEEEITEAFSLTFDIQQIPDATKYQSTGLDKALEKHLARRFEEGVEAAYQKATEDALTRVAKPLGHLVERIKAYSAGDSKRFYDSTITNVQDIAAVFEDFNLTGDPFLKKIAEQLHSFDGIEPEDLKSSEDLRKHVSKTAEQILAELQDLI